MGPVFFDLNTSWGASGRRVNLRESVEFLEKWVLLQELNFQLSQFCIESFSFSHCIVKKKKIFSAKYDSKKFIGKEKCSYSTSEFETWTGSNNFLDITQFLILVLRK